MSREGAQGPPPGSGEGLAKQLPGAKRLLEQRLEVHTFSGLAVRFSLSSAFSRQQNRFLDGR